MVDVPQGSEVLGLFPMGSAVPHPDVGHTVFLKWIG